MAKKRVTITDELRARVLALYEANPKLRYREVSEIIGISLNSVRNIKLGICQTQHRKPDVKVRIRLPAMPPKPIEGSTIRPLDKKALMAGNGRYVRTRAA